MKIKKVISHVYDRYALDPLVCYHSNTLRATIVNNRDEPLFNHLLRYREDINYMSNYKFKNDIDDISKYNNGRLFNRINIYGINKISLYFEDMHDNKNYSYSYTNNDK